MMIIFFYSKFNADMKLYRMLAKGECERIKCRDSDGGNGGGGDHVFRFTLDASSCLCVYWRHRECARISPLERDRYTFFIFSKLIFMVYHQLMRWMRFVCVCVCVRTKPKFRFNCVFE